MVVGTVDDVAENMEQIASKYYCGDLCGYSQSPGMGVQKVNRAAELFAKHIMTSLRD